MTELEAYVSLYKNFPSDFKKVLELISEYNDCVYTSDYSKLKM